MSYSEATTASNGHEPEVVEEDFESIDYDPDEELDGDDDLEWDDEEDER